MTDLLQVLPSLAPQPWAHLLPSLERAHVAVADLLTLDAVDIARHASLPAAQVRRLQDALARALHADLDWPAARPLPVRPLISLLDPVLDAALGGGLPTGCLAEFTGEAGAAKTQFLLTLLLSAQLLPSTTAPRSAIYISTESPLSTSRLQQLLASHPALASLPAADKPSLSRILSISIPDLEAQDHILRYQLPVAIARHNAALVVIDSITHNYRAELELARGPKAMAQRGAALQSTGALLRQLARDHDLAVVVANQVADRFDRAAPDRDAPPASSSSSQPAPPLSQEEAQGALDHLLRLEHQQRWFTGWGDMPRYEPLKTPSLGLVWASQLDARIVLLRAPRTGPRRADDGSNSRWKRRLKIVFAPWAADHAGQPGVEFVVTGQGLVGVSGSSTTGSGAHEQQHQHLASTD